MCFYLQGTLENGQVFDTSRQPNRGPLPFKLGEGRVIPGLYIILLEFKKKQLNHCSFKKKKESYIY